MLDVRKSFASTVAVDGVTLDLQPGEIFGLLGPNGAGKTTLLRLVLDIYRPDSGVVLYRNRALGRGDLDEIGYLPEERGLYRRETVLRVLIYLAELKGFLRTDARAAADEWLARLGMQEYRERKVETLSKGNQQKVQLLATLLHAPKLLVWDEPFSGLDPVGVQLVRELLRAERQRGCTVLLSTHLMEQAEQLCDRVGLLARGRLVRMGPLDELRAQGSRGNGPARLEEIFLDALRG